MLLVDSEEVIRLVLDVEVVPFALDEDWEAMKRVMGPIQYRGQDARTRTRTERTYQPLNVPAHSSPTATRHPSTAFPTPTPPSPPAAPPATLNDVDSATRRLSVRPGTVRDVVLFRVKERRVREGIRGVRRMLRLMSGRSWCRLPLRLADVDRCRWRSCCPEESDDADIY